MIPSSVPLKLRARRSRWLAPICAAATLVALAVSACTVPEFEFPPPPVVGAGGEPTVIPPVDHCQNGLKDAELGESDFDCGRGCLPCGAGKICGDVADCETGLLCHEGVCIAAGCMNTAQDGAETDIDCGGDGCKPCITGQVCATKTDCDSGVCTDAKCQAPACDDQTLNGKETALDCGGDCAPCAVNQPCVADKDCVSAACNDQLCGPECPDGFADCNKKNDDACEINTRTDLNNCGACGNVCQLAHATAECSAGECRIATDGCIKGYADCNGDPKDGCEVNLDQDKLNCGACNKVCPEINGAPFCAVGACQITCTQGFGDCDDKRENGCEKDVSKDANNCGECGKKCTPASGGTSYCKNDACGETICPAGFGDCNGDPDDGCEVDLRIDAKNCNTCGNLCLAANGTATCNNRVCQVATCDKGFANCSGGYADGCETNINTDTSACGGCSKPCTIDNGTPKCDMGACAVNSCSGNFRDCDGDSKNGCEINIGSDTKNCGGCGAAGTDCSTKYANATSACSNTACTAPTCKSGFGDCKNGSADGCETDTTTSPGNCGGCGMVCSTSSGAHVSSNACSNSQCQPMCSGTYLTCDNNKLNGCEADGATDDNNCNACGTVCSTAAAAHVTTNHCAGGACDPMCAGTYGDCDSSRTNGCEVDTAVSTSNCGACGKACQNGPAVHTTANTCSGSSCHPACSSLFDDCNSKPEDGCEKDVSGDVNNCGACKLVCGTSNATGTSCGSGKCSPACNSGWGKCTTPEKGCVTPLGTITNCKSCGDACTSPSVFCDPTGCVDHRDIVVSGSGVNAIGGWNGTGAPSVLTVNHTLEYGLNNNRMILVGVIASDSFLDPDLVQYDGVDMTRAIWSQDASNQSYAAVYYLLEAQLPDSGTARPVKVQFAATNVWGHGGLDVLELKNVMQVAPIATGVSTGGNCGGGNNARSIAVNFSQTGTLVYGVMAGRGATVIPSFTSGAAPNGPFSHWNDHVLNPNNMTGSTGYVFGNSNRTLDWSFNDCYNSAGAGVAIKRLNWN
jgi:hypothetical protein